MSRTRCMMLPTMMILLLAMSACSTRDQSIAPDGAPDPRIGPTVDAGLDSVLDGGTNPLADSGVNTTLDSGATCQSPEAGNQILFSASTQSADALCATTNFNLADVRELHVYTLWTGVTGEHIELRKFFSPDGSLYYQKLVAFDTQATEAVPFDPAEALPHSRTVQPTEQTPNSQQVVWDYLAVGGTWITQFHMIGSWRIEVYLDKLSGTPDMVANFALTDSSL